MDRSHRVRQWGNGREELLKAGRKLWLQWDHRRWGMFLHRVSSKACFLACHVHCLHCVWFNEAVFRALNTFQGCLNPSEMFSAVICALFSYMVGFELFFDWVLMDVSQLSAENNMRVNGLSFKSDYWPLKALVTFPVHTLMKQRVPCKVLKVLITCSRILQHAEPVTFRLCDNPTVDFSTFNSTNSDDFALRQPLKGYSVSVHLKKDKLLYFAKFCSLLNWQRTHVFLFLSSWSKCWSHNIFRIMTPVPCRLFPCKPHFHCAVLSVVSLLYWGHGFGGFIIFYNKILPKWN